MKILAYIFSNPMIQFEMRIKNYREKNRKKTMSQLRIVRGNYELWGIN